MVKNIKFEDWEEEQMKDPEFRAAVDELEPAYQVGRLRMRKGLTQAQLAELVGTKQSSIARLESGEKLPSLSFLRRVIEALGGRIEVKIYSEEELAQQAETQRAEVQQEEFLKGKIVLPSFAQKKDVGESDPFVYRAGYGSSQETTIDQLFSNRAKTATKETVLETIQ